MMTDLKDPPLLERVSRELRDRGFSPDAAQWATKALYPPGPQTRVSVPAATTEDTLSMDFRITRSIGTPTPGQSWDCLIITPPSDSQPVLIVRGNAGTDFSSSTPGPPNLTMDVHPDYATPTLTWRAFTGATLVAGETAWPNFMPRAGRHTYKSLTVHMTASDLANGGNVTSGQLPLKPEIPGSLSFNNGINTTPVAGSVIWSGATYEIPGDESALSRMCPGLYAAAAKDGMFQVLKLTDLDGDRMDGGEASRGKVMPYWSGSSSQYAWFDPCPDTVSEGSPWSAVARRNQYITVTKNGPSFPFWALGLNETGGFRGGPICGSDMSTGVTFFRGLHPDATLQATLYSGYEYSLFPHSPVVSMVSRPAEADARSIQAYCAITRLLKDAYPANYNSLALLGPAILGAIRTALPTVLKYAPSVLGAIAPQAKELVEKLIGAPSTPQSAVTSTRRKPRAAVVVERFRSRSASRARSSSRGKQRKRVVRAR